MEVHSFLLFLFLAQTEARGEDRLRGAVLRGLDSARRRRWGCYVLPYAALLTASDYLFPRRRRRRRHGAGRRRGRQRRARRGRRGPLRRRVRRWHGRHDERSRSRGARAPHRSATWIGRCRDARRRWRPLCVVSLVSLAACARADSRGPPIASLLETGGGGGGGGLFGGGGGG